MARVIVQSRGIGSGMSALYHLFRSMRPRQWLKNLLLFAGIIFSHNLGKPVLFLRSTAGFALFCMIAGAIYILNDIRDAENDRLHPKKRNRPIAADLVSPQQAGVFALVLAAVTLALSFFLSVPFFWTVLAYCVVTVLYSMGLKHVAIVDVLMVAGGFVLRAVAGVVVIRIEGGPEVPMTPWFVLCVFFLALFIAVCKRRHELECVENAAEHRIVLEEYPRPFLDLMIAVSTSAAIFAYVLYLIAAYGGKETQDLKMILTLPFVIYGIFRYLYLVYRRDEGGEPESLVLKDKPLLFNTLLWLILLLILQKWTTPN